MLLGSRRRSETPVAQCRLRVKSLPTAVTMQTLVQLYIYIHFFSDRRCTWETVSMFEHYDNILALLE